MKKLTVREKDTDGCEYHNGEFTNPEEAMKVLVMLKRKKQAHYFEIIEIEVKDKQQ